MSRPAETEVGVQVLDAAHFLVFQRALIRILQTEIAEHTFAEILDGLPTKASYQEFEWVQEGHPVLEHTQLCPGVRQRAAEFRSKFDVTDLRFSSSVLQAFLDSPAGSKTFHLRLIELLVRACHQIAVYLFQLDGAIHRHEEYKIWAEKPRDMTRWDSHRQITPFSCGEYVAVDQYPHGLADVVGYWAEARIFGGVVVFDRGESDNECRDVFIHSARRSGPFTIYPPTPTQYDSLLEFLLGEKEPDSKSSCPLPILATSENRWRWDAWDAFARYHIFRDRYERRLPQEKPLYDVISGADWPEMNDKIFLTNCMYDHLEGKPINVEEVRAAKKRMEQITPSSPCWHGGNSMIFPGLEEDTLQAVEKH